MKPNLKTPMMLAPLFASTLAATVQAQEASPVLLEEIIVTAQKREQVLSEVPMAITAMNSEDLQVKGIDSIQDLSFAVPGLTMREAGPGSYQIFMRGVANTNGGESGALVSVYQDESPMTLSGFDVLPTRVLDLSRIEVLKGPQGTLYGQGAVAGAIRYITNEPVMNIVEGSIKADIIDVDGGSVGETLQGVLNIPLIDDKLAMRVAVMWKNGGGWQDQPEAGIKDGNDEDLLNARVKLLWTPTEELSVLGTYVNYRSEYELGQGFENEDRTVFGGVDATEKLIPKIWKYKLYNLEVDYDFGNMALTSSTSYVEQDHQYPFAYFGGPETVYMGEYYGNDARYNPARQFTQELRLASTGGGDFDWTVGVYYADMSRELSADFEYIYSGILYSGLTSYEESTSESYSVFGDISYRITDKLTVGGGVRYFEDERSYTLGEQPFQTYQEKTFDSVDPRVFVSYALNEDMNLYANAAKGFRSGGFNAAGTDTYDPESVKSYEIGFKGSLFDGQVYLETAIYQTVWDDMLVRELRVFPTTGLTTIFSNAGEGEVKGFEMAVTWKPTDSLTLSAQGTIMDAEITDASDNTSTVQTGDDIDYVPDYSYTASINYDFNWTDSMPGFARLDYSYRDEMPYTDRSSFQAQYIPQYSDEVGLLDARIGLRAMAEQVSVELFVLNATNENEYIDPYHGWKNANRTRPRTVGVSVGYEF